MEKRKSLDHRRFFELSKEQSSLIQLIEGMQEIKLNNCEREKRWEWERIQLKVFKINIAGLKLNQIQTVGGLLFNEVKNILIITYAAFGVINVSISVKLCHPYRSKLCHF